MNVDLFPRPGNATGRGEQWQVPQGEQYEIA